MPSAAARCRGCAAAAARGAAGAMCTARGAFLFTSGLVVVFAVLLGLWLRSDDSDAAALSVRSFAATVEPVDVCPRPAAVVRESIRYHCHRGVYRGGQRQLLLPAVNTSAVVNTSTGHSESWEVPAADYPADGLHTLISWRHDGPPIPCPVDIDVVIGYEAQVQVAVGEVGVVPDGCAAEQPPGDAPADGDAAPAAAAAAAAAADGGPADVCLTSPARCYGVVAWWDPMLDQLPHPVGDVNVTFRWEAAWAVACGGDPAWARRGVTGNYSWVEWHRSGAEPADADAAFAAQLAAPIPVEACAGDSGLSPPPQRSYAARETFAVALLSLCGVCCLASGLVWGAQLAGRLDAAAPGAHDALLGDEAGFPADESEEEEGGDGNGGG